MIIDCKSIAQDMKNKIKNIITEIDYAPILHIYQVGDNHASNAYIRGKLHDCEEVGIEAELIIGKMWTVSSFSYLCPNISILRISLFQTNLTLMVLILPHHFILALRLAL